MKHSVARIAQQSRRVAGKAGRARRALQAARSVALIRDREAECDSEKDERERERGREGGREESEMERNGSDSRQCNCTFKVAFPRLFRRSTFIPSLGVLGFHFSPGQNRLKARSNLIVLEREP